MQRLAKEEIVNPTEVFWVPAMRNAERYISSRGLSREIRIRKNGFELQIAPKGQLSVKTHQVTSTILSLSVLVKCITASRIPAETESDALTDRVSRHGDPFLLVLSITIIMIGRMLLNYLNVISKTKSFSIHQVEWYFTRIQGIHNFRQQNSG